MAARAQREAQGLFRFCKLAVIFLVISGLLVQNSFSFTSYTRQELLDIGLQNSDCFISNLYLIPELRRTPDATQATRPTGNARRRRRDRKQRRGKRGGLRAKLKARPIQSESTNQSSATSHVVNQNDVQCNEYASPLHDADESQDVTYSLIEFKNIGKKEKQREPEESSVYSDVKTGTADDSLMYAQVNFHNKGKAKKSKGKSTPAATDETVYSEVKPRTAGGNYAAI